MAPFDDNLDTKKGGLIAPAAYLTQWSTYVTLELFKQGRIK
jgi:hypothetical protein